MAFAPSSGDIHICCCLFRYPGTGMRFSNRKETSCLPLLNTGFEPGESQTPIRQHTECLLTNRLSFRGSSLKTWTWQPVTMISKHSAHLTPLQFGIRTWLWRYTYLLLLISMLWHRQAIFESKGDKLSSSAERRIRTKRVSKTYSPADWISADKPTVLWRIKLKNLNSIAVPITSKHSANLTPLLFGIRTWLWKYTYLLFLISMLWHRQAIFESKGDKLSSSAESRFRTR